MSAKVSLVVMSMLLSVLTGLVIARGAAVHDDATRRQITIGLSLDTLKEARWQADRDTFVRRATELGAKVLDLAANSDDTVQIGDVEKLITRRVDVLVIVPHDGKAMAKAVRMAHDAGIPVIAYDRLIEGGDLDLYVSFDNVRVGELQAKYLIEHLPTPGHGKLVRIYGAKSDHNAFLFKQGQDRVLAPYIARGDIQIVHEDWADDWKPESAKRIVNAAISAHGPDFDAVLASNDGTAGGAIQALLEEGLIKDGGVAGKLVTGQDAELVACQRIARGTQSMTIYKPLHALASRAAELAFALARGKPVIARDVVNNGSIDVPAVLSDVVIVTRDNMVASVIKDGFQRWDDVYRGIPEAERPARPLETPRRRSAAALR
jgi:D-xylose transport system substrate-binding protein